MAQDERGRPSDTDDGTIARAKGASEGSRENPAGELPAGADAESVLTLVCETCGRDYHFAEAGPPPKISCDRCGGTVFREFDTVIGDEAADDFRDSTERDLRPDDAEGDVLPGDVMDLNSI
jgi:hypothetical protein